MAQWSNGHAVNRELQFESLIRPYDVAIGRVVLAIVGST